VLTDGDGGTSETETKSASVVATNDAPVLDNTLNPTLVPTQEDAKFPTGTSVFTLLNGAVTDPDAGAKRGIAVRGASATHGAWYFQLQGGSWQPMGSPSDSAARLVPSSAKVRFVPKADFNGTVNLYYRAWDQNEGQAGGTFNLSGHTGGKTAFSAARDSASLTVTPVNDKPVLSFSGVIGYVHDKPAITLAAFARVSDVDSADFAGGRLRVRITDGASVSNRLAIGPDFTVDASGNVKQGTTTIGKRVSNGFGTNELVITFNTSATKAVVQQLVRAIAFKTVGGAAGARKVVFTLSDGDGGLSADATKTVNVS
jgi:hypothetical protein